MSTNPDHSEIRRAIREHRRVQFYYVGELITAEPHAFGTGLRYQMPVLLTWEPERGWREYSSMRIRKFTVLDERYAPRHDVHDVAGSRFKEIDTAAAIVNSGRAAS